MHISTPTFPAPPDEPRFPDVLDGALDDLAIVEPSDLEVSDEELSVIEDTLKLDDDASDLPDTFAGGEDIDLDEIDPHEDIAAALPTGYRKSPSDDSVGAFFKEMARYPLLKAEEEVELARRVRFLVEVEEQQEQLSVELGRTATRAELAKKFDMTERKLEYNLYQGRVAKRKMIRSNLRLVVSIAKKYLNRGVPFLDLIQEGALGLNRAAEKFDPEKGYKFSTYAYWWIRQGITRAIANDSRTIRLPVHIVEKLNKLKKANRDLRRDLGRNPTEAELAKAIEVSPRKLRMLQQVRRRALSLNHRVGKEEETELMDLLEDDVSQSPEEQTAEVMMRQEVWDVLGDVLTKREQDIISLRYGLTHSEPFTLEEVSGIFNLSRERVRQIQAKAIRKLRRPQIAERLKGWLVH
ncbi:RpoD/SigA family RNA polymerase sigma factor [Leptolyngbya sp. FACHB-261]|nr:RpoD/SigA family RNA polymerase sigma factor [Leptolyngbya sp. FACHB-261]